MESCLPPGFRFHPTEEELVGYYLYRKVNSLRFDLDVISDIDLYRMEPWEIQGNMHSPELIITALVIRIKRIESPTITIDHGLSH